MLWLVFPVALLLGCKQLREHAPMIAFIMLNVLGIVYTYYSAARDTSLTAIMWLKTGFDRVALH